MPAPTSEKDEKAQKERYLRAYRQISTLSAGCKAARVSPNTVYKWRELDAQFVLEEQQARDACADAIEASIIRRAKNRSDVLAIFLLKAMRPEKYRETSRLEHSGPDGRPIQTEDVSFSDDDRAAYIIAILERARKRIDRPDPAAQPDLETLAGSTNGSVAL